MFLACQAPNLFALWQAKASGFPDGKAKSKWRNLHREVKQALPKHPSTCEAHKLLLHLPRLQDAWGILAAQHASSQHLVADLSQTVTRASVRTDGHLPTITPGSILAAREAGRVISPLEKVLLHGFPVHRMLIPAEITDSQLESMGGNTMHVHVVGAAILMVLALVDWENVAAHRPCQQSTVHRSLPTLLGQGNGLDTMKKKSSKAKLQKLKSNASGVINHALKVRWAMHAGKQQKAKPASTRTFSRVARPTTVLALKGTRWG